MISYAGVGSREITPQEEEKITLVSSLLSSKCLLYSGNAEGSDVTFQRGSKGNCIVFVPWYNFNREVYSGPGKILVPDYSLEAEKSVKEFLAKAKKYTDKVSVHKIMRRNYHQVMGYKEYPKVSFVIYCATTTYNSDGTIKEVSGGTGQAVRIAVDNKIPVFNVRDKDFKQKFLELYKTL